jgi:hypothetical protein
MSGEQQPKPSLMDRELSPRGIFIVYLVLVLFTVAPILSVAIAGAVARFCGCRLDEGGPHPCILWGVDVGGLLYCMGVAGWFMLLTLPLGALAILAFTLELRRDRKRRAA